LAGATTLALVMAVSACSSGGTRRSAATITTSTTRIVAAEQKTAGLAPLSDPSLTPRGWSGLSLGAIQISVPSSWQVSESSCAGDEPSAVFVNVQPTLGVECSLPANAIEMTNWPSGPVSHAEQTIINGVPVREGLVRTGRSTTLVVSALGIEVRLAGPLSARVLATLTRSPLSVVLNSSVRSMPVGWTPVIFGGLRMSVPAGWKIQRTDYWGGCPGDNISPNVLELNTAQVLLAPPCVAPLSTAGALAARPGMVIFAGPLVKGPPVDATCFTRDGLRICVDPPPPPTGGEIPGRELNLLTAQVTVPGQRVVDQVELGLTGTGMTPLQVFDSLTPAA
jgi:hypothetical protein